MVQIKGRKDKRLAQSKAELSVTSKVKAPAEGM